MRSSELPDRAGIYKITNAVNGRIYIGCAVNIRARWHSHRGALGRGEHHNLHLQAAWKKYGPGAFYMRPLLLCDRADLQRYEQLCLDAYRAVSGGGYNKCPVAGRTIGKKANPASIAKIAATKRGMPMSPEARANHAKAMSRPETRQRISAAKKGKPKAPVSDAHRAALSASQIGKVISPETRAKLAAANLGTKHGPHSEATRLKMSLTQKGRTFSAEHRARLCEAQRRRFARAA